MNGKVFLVGAGPGDYKLITLRALECIREADVIVYDRLASPQLLQYKKEDAELIYVGKKSSDHTKTQDEINEIICEKALEGKIVTRLKGGDPYVFGRGGEEGQYLISRGVEVEVVPGITSAIGGLAYAGIPITHRDYASSFHVITGHLKDENAELNWEVLAKLKGTLVFLMGMAELEKITTRLIDNGMAEDTPVAVINWATTERQKVATGTLKSIYEISTEKGLSSPSLIVVGQVVDLRGELNFFENKPLRGKKVLVTRARKQSSKLSDRIYDLGGMPIEFPVIKIKDISDSVSVKEELEHIKDYTYMVFTSQNAVNIFFNRLLLLGRDLRDLANAKIVAIGKATADEIQKYHLKADIIPQKYIAEGIYDELSKVLTPEDKVLIPRAKEAREFLVEDLSKICKVTELKIYETVLGEGQDSKEEVEELLEKKEIDYITFTSSSTVKNLLNILQGPQLLKGHKLLSIGPITSKTIEEFGLDVHSEAEDYHIEGLIQALLKEEKNDC